MQTQLQPTGFTPYPQKFAAALRWLGRKPATGPNRWFRYATVPQGCGRVDIVLPPQDKSISEYDYQLLQRWILACHRACEAGVQSMGEITAIYCCAQMAARGPKVFYPTLEQCEAMLNVEIDLPKDYYRQPYPEFVVKFPAEFIRRQTAEAETKRFPTWASACLTPNGKHLFVITDYVDWDGTVNVISLHTPGTIETALKMRYEIHGPESEYDDCTVCCQRLCLNFALMLTNFRHLLHYREQQLADAIDRKLADNRTKPADRRALQERKDMLVQEITPEQNTRFYDEAPAPASEPHGGTHASPRPHWRRGHWRREAGYRDILTNGGKPRAVFIRPVLVRSVALADPNAPITVNYRSESHNHLQQVNP
jgi:hypothetical protein